MRCPSSERIRRFRAMASILDSFWWHRWSGTPLLNRNISQHARILDGGVLQSRGRSEDCLVPWLRSVASWSSGVFGLRQIFHRWPWWGNHQRGICCCPTWSLLPSLQSRGSATLYGRETNGIITQTSELYLVLIPNANIRYFRFLRIVVGFGCSKTVRLGPGNSERKRRQKNKKTCNLKS